MNKLDIRDKKMKEGLINPVKWVFPRTQTKELLSSRLYENLQRSLSDPDNFFLINKSHLKKNNKSYNREIFDILTDCIVIEKNKLPKRFIELFDLDLKSDNLEQDVREIFKRARFLKNANSHRIIMIDDKIIIFRNEEKLIHINENKKLTQWEKRRTKIETTFNTFNNIYDAIRSQHHTIKSIEKSQNDYELLQNEIIWLAQDLKSYFKENTKDETIKRKIDSIIKDLNNFKNSRVLAAKLHDLQTINFQNKSIDSKHLEWAQNKFRKRFDDLTISVWIITKHLNLMENILRDHEYALDYLLSQLKFTDKELAISNYNRSYDDIYKKYWDIAPFNTFNKWITKYQKDKELLPKFIDKINLFFDMYKSENEKKLKNIDLNTNSEISTIKDSISSEKLEESIKKW